MCKRIHFKITFDGLTDTKASEIKYMISDSEHLKGAAMGAIRKVNNVLKKSDEKISYQLWLIFLSTLKWNSSSNYRSSWDTKNVLV